MKFDKIALLVLYLLAIGVFIIANQMTPDPGTASGNGNPALAIVWILFPLFIAIVILWVRIFRLSRMNIAIYISSIFALLIHLLVASVYRQKELNDYRELIKNVLLNREGVADEDYIQAITSGLSFHINHLNFNLNTYVMFVSFSLLVAIVYTLWNIWEIKNESQK